MARKTDPDSAKDQFFINLVDNVSLNHSKQNAGYCVFGKVTEGFDVIKKIGKVDVDSDHVPREPVEILKIIPLSY